MRKDNHVDFSSNNLTSQVEIDDLYPLFLDESIEEVILEGLLNSYNLRSFKKIWKIIDKVLHVDRENKIVSNLKKKQWLKKKLRKNSIFYIKERGMEIMNIIMLLMVL